MDTGLNPPGAIEGSPYKDIPNPLFGEVFQHSFERVLLPFEQQFTHRYGVSLRILKHGTVQTSLTLSPKFKISEAGGFMKTAR